MARSGGARRSLSLANVRRLPGADRAAARAQLRPARAHGGGERAPGHRSGDRHLAGGVRQGMAAWIFEPGHTEAEFRARHMMVTWVRGLFKDIHGRLELDFDSCLDATFQGEIDAAGIWPGQSERDAHLRAADFLDVENHPKITFQGRFTERTGDTAFKGSVELTIRGVTRTVPLDV